MEIRMRDFLAGHVLRQGMLLFEDGMGPWVKQEAREHLNRKLGVDPDDDAIAAATHAADVAAWEGKVAALTRRHEELSAKLESCAKGDKSAVMKERKEISMQLKGLKDQSNHTPPVPKWVYTCREYFGPKMRKHVHADSRWDMLTIVSVMRALLPDVFAKRMPDHFHAKELLDGLLRTIEVRNGRAHQAELTESDVVEALRQMGAVLRRCGCDDARSGRIDTLLSEAKGLVEQAREEGDGDSGVMCAGPTLSVDDANTQQLYVALVSWELHVEAAMGLVTVSADSVVTKTGKGRLEYSGGTVAFGRDLDPRWDDVVKPLKPHFQVVARARNWYFHQRVDDKCDVAAAFAAMAAVASAIVVAPLGAVGVAPWQSPALLLATTPATLRLSVLSVRMSVPVARVGATFVGRDAVVDDVTVALGPGARVLMHGLPGVGKDTVMAEVAHRSEVRSMGGLQAWLQASSDVVLRRQLIELFATHRPAVVNGLTNNVKAAIAAIKKWLATCSDWVLFVEDVSPSSATLWEVLPAAGVGGCALVTSQSALESTTLAPTKRVELAPITTDESIELLRLSTVFVKKAPAPPEAETEDALLDRCAAVGGADVYVAPPDNEKAKACKQRRNDIEAKLFEHAELSRPELREFLETTLGNLPLSVALCAQLLRADERVGGVLDLIALFKRTADLAEMDRTGRNPMMDTHYFGLVLSVKIALDRLRNAEGVPQADRDHAVDLLAMLSLLDRAQTPVELLRGHGTENMEISTEEVPTCYAAGCRTYLGEYAPCYSPTCHAWQQRLLRLTGLVRDGVAIFRARDLCVEHGLLQAATEDVVGGWVFVGVMHQLVQRCLLWELVTTCGEGSAVMSTVRSVLERRFDFNGNTPPSEWPRLRRLMLCMQAWTAHVLGNSMEARGRIISQPRAVSWVDRDVGIIDRWAWMLHLADGDASTAQRVFITLLKQMRRVLPADHPGIASCTNNLATTYSNLGRHEDARKLTEEALAFRRRVLPSDHPDIALTMGNLASTYSALGRYEDALKLDEETLSFQRRVLPADHPHIATSMNNLASAYSNLGRHEDACKLQKEVLAIRRRVLPADHPDIAQSMGNLASTYSVLGRNEDARKLLEEVLAFVRRVLPADHPDIALPMDNLASIYSALGRHDEALTLRREVLEFRKRVQPADHPHIATSMNNLASTYSNLERHEDARKLEEDVLTFRRRVLPTDHADIATSMNGLAATCHALGRHEDAHKLHEEALAFRRRVLPTDHADIATSMSGLASTYYALGRHEDARKLQEQALAILKRALPADHSRIATFMNILAVTYNALGRHEYARERQEEALELQKRVLPADHPHIATCMKNLALTYSALGRHEYARKLHEEALAIRRRVQPSDHPHIAQSMANVALTYSDLGRHDEARKLNEEVLSFRRRVLPADHPDIATSMNILALTYSDLGRHEDARKLQGDSLAFRRRVLPADHPDIAKSMGNLATLLWKCGDRRSAVEHMNGAIAILVRAGDSKNHELVMKFKRALQAMTGELSAGGPTQTCFGPPPPPPPSGSPEKDLLCPCASGNYTQCYYHL